MVKACRPGSFSKLLVGRSADRDYVNSAGFSGATWEWISVKKLSTFQFWALTWFSKPACDRQLYKLAAQHKPKCIVQFGLASLQQAEKLIQVCQHFSGCEEIRYTGVDLFEARTNKVPGLTLKEAHRVLATTGAKTRVMPGDAPQMLPRMANQLTGTELLVVSLDGGRDTLDSCWFFIPRMLQTGSLVLLQEHRAAGGAYQPLSVADVEQLAQAAGRPAAKAA
jgi:hypothetical protein